ncbi:MAG TPA: N-acetylmuramoyl-L-alanine amidase-like domain-containing protein [Gemmatimonadales bacterium]|nr:N-acetylmuramoyl-L-alanine amidase-like domain-containing protein [Gemmatimonadales bacterium]
MTDPDENVSRRDLLRSVALGAAALMLPGGLEACKTGKSQEMQAGADPDLERLTDWTRTLQAEKLAGRDARLGRSAIRVGELAAGTPYQPYTLEAYLKSGGSPLREPLTLSLTRFDCVTLVESCIAVARLAGVEGTPQWEGFGREIERMRYRGGDRRGYASRLHYFSEWISDGEKRGLVKDVGAELGGAEDARPLRFMTEHRASYPGLASDDVFREIGAVERRISRQPRRVIPTKRIPEVVSRIETGDVLAFATEIPGLDVTHTALAYRDENEVLRVLHAPLSGGVVEITRATLPEYVAAIRRSTGILVARPEG